MTITNVARTLTSLKNFDKTFRQSISESKFAFVSRGGKDTRSGKLLNEVKEEQTLLIKSSLDKIDDVFNKRCAIAQANLTQQVTIGKMTMSLAEAMIYKNHVLPLIIELRDRIKADNRLASIEYNKYDNDFVTLSKDKYAADVISLKPLFEPVLHSIDAELEDLNTRIDFFENELDSLLNEINPSLMIDL